MSDDEKTLQFLEAMAESLKNIESSLESIRKTIRRIHNGLDTPWPDYSPVLEAMEHELSALASE